MNSIGFVNFAVCFAFIITTAYADVSCYECNVWKAGYGHQCSNPRIRDDCTVCMKTETVVHMGYYKNTPRTSKIISRICAKSNTVHFSDECHTYDSSDGTNTRCYCSTDRCNSAPAHHGLHSLLFCTAITIVRSLYKLL